MATFSRVIYPGGDSASRVAQLAEGDLACARDAAPDRIGLLVETLIAVWEATRAPGIAQRFVYWACPDASAPEEMFRVSPLVRQALRRIGHV
ncbi:hypothetical protein [Nocardia sp. NPDC057030]|uniref:hypothetical protein n=1 Tax=unclassified Nocardia TaxID=2637762 RepID=UPI003634F953